ncbi:hypothetical protein SERLA73DRAFT_166546 [Serpula lacrymans var. lacrymans S7.3]|uniref:F-box domain-containing protein n=2 Tax=Serpula lacrymans var. lacrymans TaxID=341189 RepID=F8PPG8_SERL3|nr:uncharacterized protein SERLADRAFT_413986 [Serpula lacrymans var. lacrymans S7.9]EGO02045.1 hypothetical protein SERLA73DRAFT_166546 [Serpula lacrymans var. lacrymans S7.3]EGO27667.1 hypothetical protein SERLADRAFT_413986 [Serpula lacrymans var. lacrymans S7.9]
MSHFEQLQPESYIFRLPTEIWQECWSYSSRNDLQRLVSVCRLFRQTCQKTLYRKLTYGGSDLFDLMLSLYEPDSWSFERLLKRFETMRTDPDGDDVRAMVHECHFVGLEDSRNLLSNEAFQIHYRNLPKVLETIQATTKAFVSLLSALPNIRILHLSWIDLDDEIWNILEALPNLDALVLNECQMAGGSERHMSLKTFNMSSSGIPNHLRLSTPLQILAPSRLTELTLEDEYCTGAVLSSLISLGTFHHLTHLAVHVEETTVDKFLTLLRAAPRLKTLKISGCHNISRYPHALPSDVVPLLTSYDGPLHLAHLFTTNRPVTDVKLRLSIPQGQNSINSLFLSDQIGSSMASLSRSTIGVKCLALSGITSSLDSLDAVTAYLPDLRELDVSFSRLPSFPLPLDEEIEGRYQRSTNVDGLKIGCGGPFSSIQQCLPKDHPVSIQHLVCLIADGHATLPAQIEVLRLRCDFTARPAAEGAGERLILEKLSELYPRVREVCVGTNLVWYRMGESWSSSAIRT